MNLMPFKIPPSPPLGKGGALESPPLSKGDLGGFLSNRPLNSTALRVRVRGYKWYFLVIPRPLAAGCFIVMPKTNSECLLFYIDT